MRTGEKDPKTGEKSITWILDRVGNEVNFGKTPQSRRTADLDVGSSPTPRSGEPQDVANQKGRKKHNSVC